MIATELGRDSPPPPPFIHDQRIKQMFYSPASELGLSQAHLEAVLARSGLSRALLVAGQFVSLDTIDAPGTGAGTHAEARLLRVDGEYGELGLGQSARHVVGVRGEEHAEPGLVVDGGAALVALAGLETIGQHQGAGHRVEEFAGGGEDVSARELRRSIAVIMSVQMSVACPPLTR